MLSVDEALLARLLIYDAYENKVYTLSLIHICTAVFTLQRQLNRITKDYPFLGKLTVDGVFGKMCIRDRYSSSHSRCCPLRSPSR